MVKGCQRKVIFLKNCESELFSEAYFIVNEKAYSPQRSEDDMIAEANRIVEENLTMGKKTTPLEKLPTPVRFVLRHCPAFLLGAFTCAFLFLIF